MKKLWLVPGLVCLTWLASSCGSEAQPAFVGDVYPPPGETVSRSSWEDWDGYGGSGNIGSGRDICATIYVGPLLRPGDYWDYRRGFENVQIAIDGRLVDEDAVHSPPDCSPVTLVDENTIVATRELDFDEDGIVDEVDLEYEIIASGPCEDLVCWQVDMVPGTHTVDLTASTSTGEEHTYTWTFEAVP